MQIWGHSLFLACGTQVAHLALLNAPKSMYLHLQFGAVTICILICQQRWLQAHAVGESSLFAYWLWSCVVTVLILLTKYWRPRDVTLLNYFLQTWSITSACWICTTDGRSISLAATIRPPLYQPPTSPRHLIVETQHSFKTGAPVDISLTMNASLQV